MQSSVKQHILLLLFAGLAFPPLYFYNGGVKEFLATVKQHVLLVRLLLFHMRSSTLVYLYQL